MGRAQTPVRHYYPVAYAYAVRMIVGLIGELAYWGVERRDMVALAFWEVITERRIPHRNYFDLTARELVSGGLRQDDPTPGEGFPSLYRPDVQLADRKSVV